MRRLHGRGHEEIHERAGDYIALGVVTNLLAHRYRKSLGQPAMHLALNDHWVNASAAIVERIEAPDLVDSGIDVDVHYADIGAERIGHVGRIVITHRF